MTDDDRTGRRPSSIELEANLPSREVRLETRQRHVSRRAAQLRGWAAGTAELLARVADPMDPRHVAPRDALEILRLKLISSEARLATLANAEFEDWETAKIAVEGEWRDLAVEFKSVVGWVRALSRRS